MPETHYLRIYTPTGGHIAYPERPECATKVTRESTADGALAYWKLRDDGTEQMCIIAPGQWSAIEQLTEAEHAALMADYERQRSDYWEAVKKSRLVRGTLVEAN